MECVSCSFYRKPNHFVSKFQVRKALIRRVHMLTRSETRKEILFQVQRHFFQEILRKTFVLIEI